MRHTSGVWYMGQRTSVYIDDDLQATCRSQFGKYRGVFSSLRAGRISVRLRSGAAKNVSVSSPDRPLSVTMAVPGAGRCRNSRCLRAHSGALCLLHVLHHRRRDRLVLQGGAELDVLGAGLGQRYVARRKVERIACFGGFLVVGEAEGQLAFEHITPVRAVAAVAWQPLQQRGTVDVLAE